jgi:hypothetical protein
MENNQFIVDLGDLKLTAQQKQSINKSIQLAVSLELSKIKAAEKVKTIDVENGKLVLNPLTGRGIKLPSLVNGKVVIPSKWIRSGIWSKLSKEQFEAIAK